MNEKPKIEGVDNKELIAFVVIISVVILLLIFEMFFFKGRTEVAEESAQMQERLEEMQSVTVVSEQKTVYKELNNIVEMMNNKEYEKIYDLLKEDYKNYYFKNYDDYEEFIKTYAKIEYYPKYTSYYRDGNLYYVMVDFLRSKYTREDLLSPEVSKVDTIVLEEGQDGNFKFAMNGFVECTYHAKSKIVDDVTFTLLDSVRNTETMKVTVMVENNSDKSLLLSTTNLQPNILGGMSAKLSPTSLVIIEPGQINTMVIEFYMQYNSGKKFNGVTITGASFSDGTILEDVYLSK